MKNKDTFPTSAEITRRLRAVTELRNLCLSLGRAKRADTSAGVRQEQKLIRLPETQTK